MPQRRTEKTVDAGALTATLDELSAAGPLPALFVFDLDYTLWPAWVDTMDPPFKRRGTDINRVYDRTHSPLSFFPHVPAILYWLKRNDVPIAIASRTSAPDAARQALRGLFVEDHTLPQEQRDDALPGITFMKHMEIYPGSKIRHFKSIHAALGHKYEDMIFYDDEYRNAEVGRELGVHFVEVGHSGTDVATFVRGVKEWQAKTRARSGDPDAGSALL